MQKTAALILFFISLTVFSACPSGGGVPPVVVTVGRCAEAAIAQQIPGIIADVEAAVASNDWSALLKSLVAKLGADGAAIVDCAVHEVMGSSRAQMAAAPKDPISRAKVEHAQAWLGR